MAQHVEPMEVDAMDTVFDNKENSYHHSNVLSTEKGYEELDVSELNMKLRYSITPASSPMSKSYTAHVDNRIHDTDDSLNHTNENANLTRSLNSTMTHDIAIKSLKSLPLQTISTEQALDNRSSVLRQLDSTVTGLDNNMTVTISGPTDIDENLSLHSSSSSTADTPEATTPTNINRNEEGSPIIRGLKSVINMFRSSQSSIAPVVNDDTSKHDIGQMDETYCEDQKTQNLASTSISAHRNIDSSSSKRSSPLKDSIIFNDDLEKELEWKEDTILFSNEKIPIHKLLLPHTKATTMSSATPQTDQKLTANLNSTVEDMDVSFNNSLILDNTITEAPQGIESDGEFVDCETTFTKTETQNDEAHIVVSDIIEEIVSEVECKVYDTKNSENSQNEALEQLEPLDTEHQNPEAKEINHTSEDNLKPNIMKDVVDIATAFNQTVTKQEAKDTPPTQNTNAGDSEVIITNDIQVEFSADTLIMQKPGADLTSNSIKTITKELLSQDHDETDIVIRSMNISNEDLSLTPEKAEEDVTITNEIDKMIMILQQIEHENIQDVNDVDQSTESHRGRTVEKQRESTKSQESASESILSNQMRSCVEPANIPDDEDVALKLKTENTNNDQHRQNQLSENIDILNETNDIVNCLTEMIGESDTSVGIINQTHIVKVIEGSECPNEMEALPELINEIITSINLIDEAIEILPTSTQTSTIAKSDEQICESLNKSEAKEDGNTTAILKDNNEITIDEEITLSGYNSPFVSVTAELEIDTAKGNVNETIIQFVKNENPSSPPILSKGYNFNFDEMDDPFATNTKIRMTPPPITTNEVNECNDNVLKKESTAITAIPKRRRSQPPERKRQTINRKKINTTFDASNINDQYSNSDSKLLIQDTMEINVTENKEVSKVLDETIGEHLDATPDQVEQNQPPGDIIVKEISETKTEPQSMTKSTEEDNACYSDHSTYFSQSSTSDICVSKNVFNLPEIDDKNFNPFATKSKMRQSPPIDIINHFTTQSRQISAPNSMIVIQPKEDAMLPAKNVKEQGHEDKTDIELNEKDSSYNKCNISVLSLSADNKDVTTREVNTEDEDTEEGPFLETGDAVDKILGFDDNNMMQFNEISTKANEENADDGELFIDAEAFEFLLNQNQCNVVTDSGKESLFLKFDPLFAKRNSTAGEIFATLSQVQKRQSTPTKPTRPSLRNEASPIAGPSNLNTTYDADTNVTEDSIEDLNITVAKPTMVVTPAVNAAVTPRNKTTTPPRSNRRSINFTSPAMAVIDRLLSLSGNNSLLGQNTTGISPTNRTYAESDIALTQLRELLAEKEINVYQLRTESKELQDRLSTMETQVKILEADGQDRLNKINDLNNRLAEKTKINKSMAAVVEEYERTIASLIAETEQDKKRHAEERMRLISERDEQTAHLASMEVSFSDLHSKYEKSKQIILSCKANEEMYKKSIMDFEENLAKMQLTYEALKQHATSKLNHANKEFQRLTKAHESEVLKHNALIKRKDMHITSLEETLAQKNKANEELTAICDELINKVG